MNFSKKTRSFTLKSITLPYLIQTMLENLLKHIFSLLQADLDGMSAEAKVCSEKASKAMVDAAKLADELRAEQEAALVLSKARKLADVQVKDLQTKLDEADMNALKGGKKAINKLNTRIMELNSELEAEGRRFAEGQRNLKKSERHIAELTFAKDEDRKNHERMQALIDGLQGKIKSYKTQIEEAEEAAALNLAKFRKVMVSLGESIEVIGVKETALAKAKSARSASLTPL